VIGWDAPGPYVVAFTTREGGVSTGPFAALNLGSRDDDPGRVAENRALACAELGLDPALLAANRQRHTARALRARAGVRTRTADALWTTEPGLPMLAMSADCVPIAIGSTRGTPALAVVHAGWRGLAGGIVASAARAVGGAGAAAIVGPSIGPCCYEVGPDVSDRFDPDLCHGRMLDLWTAAERALRGAGVATVERVDLCTHCHAELFFSYRRTGAPHGTQGVLGAVER